METFCAFSFDNVGEGGLVFLHPSFFPTLLLASKGKLAMRLRFFFLQLSVVPVCLSVCLFLGLLLYLYLDGLGRVLGPLFLRVRGLLHPACRVLLTRKCNAFFGVTFFSSLGISNLDDDDDDDDDVGWIIGDVGRKRKVL